jgi:hypothetical protein
MTLNRAIIDLRRHFWEYGQLYLALWRVRHPENLCRLLSECQEKISSSDPIAMRLRIPVDRQVVNIISTISGNTTREVDTAFSMAASHPSTIELPVNEFTLTWQTKRITKRMTE